MEEKEKKSIGREILEWIVCILVALIITYILRNFVFTLVRVDGASMDPTLAHGERLVMIRLGYEPSEGDIVVVEPDNGSGAPYIKRIIGMPGETVQIIDGMVYIDGEMLEESYGKEVMQYSGVASDPIELGNDEYFVLGDNRNNSSDSRDPSVGNIKEDQIIGKAFIRIWPLNKFGILKHQ